MIFSPNNPFSVFPLGVILLSSCPAFVLFDTGATHSFVASQFVKRNKIINTSGDMEWHVSTPMGKTMITTEMCKSCKLEIGGRTLLANLIILEMSGYDVILGMD